MSWQNEQRILQTKRMECILEEMLPLPKDEVLAKLSYQMGMTRQKTMEYIRLLFVNKLIDYDEMGMNLVWKGKK